MGSAWLVRPCANYADQSHCTNSGRPAARTGCREYRPDRDDHWAMARSKHRLMAQPRFRTPHFVIIHTIDFFALYNNIYLTARGAIGQLGIPDERLARRTKAAIGMAKNISPPLKSCQMHLLRVCHDGQENSRANRNINKQALPTCFVARDRLLSHRRKDRLHRGGHQCLFGLVPSASSRTV